MSYEGWGSPAVDHRPPVTNHKPQIPHPDVPGSYQSAGKAMRLEILLEELLDCLCACSLVIALDLDGDLVILLDSKTHQSKELSHIAALVALPDSDLGAELLGLFDEDSSGTSVNSERISNCEFNFFHDIDSPSLKKTIDTVSIMTCINIHASGREPFAQGLRTLSLLYYETVKEKTAILQNLQLFYQFTHLLLSIMTKMCAAC